MAARAELGEFVEYDLDNEDEDWLYEFNKDRKILAPEKCEFFLIFYFCLFMSCICYVNLVNFSLLKKIVIF